MINHISFDFWDTLYVSNPNFRTQRAGYIRDKYGFSAEEVNLAVNKTKNMCDYTSEKTMCTVDHVTQAWHLLDALGVASISNAVDLANFTHEDFLENPPVSVFKDGQMLDLLNEGLSISIGCNTGLISGNSIIEMLSNTNKINLFDFCIFSDHIGYFKPSPFFLQRVLDHHKCKADSFEEILHIGDNRNTDGYMCQLTNSNYLFVEKGSLDFKSILNYL